MTRCQVTTGILAGATLSSTAVAAGTSGGDATLRSAGGMPLMAALERRHSTREYSERPLSAVDLPDRQFVTFAQTVGYPRGTRRR